MASRKILHDSVIPLHVDPGESDATPDGASIHAASGAHDDEILPLLFSLELPGDATARLEEMIARGEIATPETLHSDFAVPREQVDRVTEWLKGEGFEITSVSRDGTSVHVRATVRQIRRSLGVDMARVTQDGATYTAARNAPSLPADVGQAVHAIIGLQPFRRPRHHGAAHGAAPAPANDFPPRPPYTTSELLTAYNAASLGASGAGQTIAILICTVPLDSDLEAFWKHNGVPVNLGRIEKINVRNVTLPAPEGEETIDVSWTSGLAPDATIRVYATGDLGYVYQDQALDRILDDLASYPAMRQLSMSFGLGETYMGGPKGEVATQHQKFLKLAAAGVNVFVSSGDWGSNPNDKGQSGGPLQVQYPASDPVVIGVGGTSMYLTTDGTLAGEPAWDGSGGGKSIFFSRPAWQSGTGCSGTMRLVPDVSLAADPAPGGYLVCNGIVTIAAGTSWSTPMWAAFCALMNEVRAKAGKPPLPFLSPLLYKLAGTSSFRDIVGGSNGAYDATKGYDLVTGIGVPDIAELTRALP